MKGLQRSLQHPAERLRRAFERGRCDSGSRVALKNRFDKNHGYGAYGDDAGDDSELVGCAALFLFQIEQHDDEEKQHYHRARIDEDLNGREEERVQQDEQTGHRNDGQCQKHRAGDRVATERICHDQKAAEQRQRGEEVEEQVLHRQKPEIRMTKPERNPNDE